MTPSLLIHENLMDSERLQLLLRLFQGLLGMSRLQLRLAKQDDVTKRHAKHNAWDVKNKKILDINMG